jgi:glycosyltransferase involved in cell wall biosynthesis
MSHCVFDGLTCIYCGWKARVAGTKRVCPKLVGKPGTFEAQVSRYASELGAWIAAGSPKRTDGQVDELHVICSSNDCGKFEDGRCGACGCAINKSRFGWANKLRMATTRCPLPVPRWVESAGPVPEGMRVGLILPNLLSGGVERWAVTLAKYLASGELGARVSALAFVGRESQAVESLASEFSQYAPIVASFEAPWAYRVPSPAETIRAVALGSDILAVWAVTGELLRAVRATGKPIVGVAHCAAEWWAKDSSEAVDHWVAVADAALPAIPGEKATVIRNGIDLDRLIPTESLEATRDAAGIPRGCKVAVSIGRFAREKRLDLACQALEHLPADWRLWLVGDGNQEWTCRAAAGAHADRLIVSPARQDIGNVLAAADVAVLTSAAEGYGLAPVEAIAAGIPLAATRVGVLREFPSYAAEWIPLECQPAEVANAVLSASLRHRETLSALADFARMEHSGAAMACRWTQFLMSVIKLQQARK